MIDCPAHDHCLLRTASGTNPIHLLIINLIADIILSFENIHGPGTALQRDNFILLLLWQLISVEEAVVDLSLILNPEIINYNNNCNFTGKCRLCTGRVWPGSRGRPIDAPAHLCRRKFGSWGDINWLITADFRIRIQMSLVSGLLYFLV